MLEELKDEAIIEKVGGRFKLSTLIQKRIVQLKQGSRALVDMDTEDTMKLVLQEKECQYYFWKIVNFETF